MSKMPRKEDLLPKAQPPVVSSQSKPVGENAEVETAKANAEIAVSKQRQVEAEIQTKLKQEGYESIEQAKTDTKQKLTEANQILETARQQEQSINDQLEAIEQGKQKVTNAYGIVKEREAKIDARLEEAIRLENGQKERTTQSEIVRQEVQVVIDYHNAKILPCVKALRKSVKTLYTLWTVLEDPKEYDKETLSEYVVGNLNYVGKLTTVIDKYLDNVKGVKVQIPPTPKDTNALD